MSRKLDHTEFGYLAGTDVMTQMLRNKLVITPSNSVTIKHINGLLDTIDEHMMINAQGLYHVRRIEQGVTTIMPAHVIVYTEHQIDRESIRELVDVTLAAFLLSE